MKTIMVITETGQYEVKGVRKIGYYKKGWLRKTGFIQLWDTNYKIMFQMTNVLGWYVC